MKSGRFRLVAACGLLLTAPLFAVDFVVDSTADEVDASPGDGSCATASTTCTLRAAIQEANALAGSDTITVPAGVFKLSITGASEDAAATGDLDITEGLTITGAGENATFVDATPSDTGAVDRVFDVAPAAQAIVVVIEHLTIQRGTSSAGGGGIRNQANLTVRDARLRWNTASGAGRGGGVLQSVTGYSAPLTLLRARVEDNVGSAGGGVYVDKGKVVITDSSISWNSSSVGGGGFATNGSLSSQFVISGSTFNHNITSGVSADGGGIGIPSYYASGSITNSTIFGNRAGDEGGGFYDQGVTTINNVTIAHNSSVDVGGGYRGNSYATMKNSIVADNSSDGGTSHDCWYLNSADYNLIENTTGCTFAGTTTNNVTGSDPMLAPLAFYGGLTRTAPPLPGSPAIEAGNAATCAATDQAGTSRPLGSICDIGAWEANGSEAVPTPPSGYDFIVTSFDDYDGFYGQNDTNAGDGVCVTADGTCDLRAAIEEANALGGTRKIYLPAGVYDDRQTVTGDNGAHYGDLDIASGAAITIQGEGAQDTIINGRIAGEPVFQVLGGGTLDLNDVMVRKGSGNQGGGVYNGGTLHLLGAVLRDNYGNGGAGLFTTGNVIIDTSTLRDNRANGSGGGLQASGASASINIYDSAFIDNVAAGLGDGGGMYLSNSAGTTMGGTTVAGNRGENGGGIYHQSGSLSIAESTISGNTSYYISTLGYGGGIYSGGNITIENSTISGNDAKSVAGGMYVYNHVGLTNVTVADNVAPDTGGLVFQTTATVVNTIVADNTDVQCSGTGTMTSNDGNLSSDATCSFTATHDQENTDPLLDVLADNGGLTKTQALLTGSPAIDAGNDAYAPATDQRGLSRPQGSQSDVGAFEVLYVPEADLAITKTDGQTDAVPGMTASYSINAANGGPEDVTGATVTDVLDGTLIDVASASWTCTPDSGAGVNTTCPASGTGTELGTGVSIDLEAGDAVTFTVSAPVLPDATGSLVNTADISAAGINDSVSGNDSSTDTDTLTPQADLSITKSDGVDGVIAGDMTTYTIGVANAGPSDAPSAMVTDNFPADLTGCTWTCAGSDGGSCGASGSGDISESVDLPAGGSVSFEATCTMSLSATGTVSNTATVAAPGGVSDLVSGNDSATDDDLVLGPCGFLNDVVLSDATIDTTEVVKACQTITLGGNLDVVVPADLTVTAGSAVIFVDGVAVGSTFVAGIDAVLAEP